LALEQNPSNYFSLLNQLFGRLLNPKQSNSRREKFTSSYPLDKACNESKDKRDKLLDLWTAMEFLVSGTKVKKLFTKFEIKKIKKYIK